jgi:hypothetical protein
MAVEIQAGATFEAGLPKPLFSIHAKPGGWPFDVSRDGRFLVNERVHTEGGAPVTVVLNWSAQLDR